MPRHRPYALLLAGAILLFSACERTKTSPFTAEFAVQIAPLAASNGDLSRARGMWSFCIMA